jgi:hypothetical protein
MKTFINLTLFILSCGVLGFAIFVYSQGRPDLALIWLGTAVPVTLGITALQVWFGRDL